MTVFSWCVITEHEATWLLFSEGMQWWLCSCCGLEMFCYTEGVTLSFIAIFRGMQWRLSSCELECIQRIVRVLVSSSVSSWQDGNSEDSCFFRRFVFGVTHGVFCWIESWWNKEYLSLVEHCFLRRLSCIWISSSEIEEDSGGLEAEGIGDIMIHEDCLWMHFLCNIVY